MPDITVEKGELGFPIEDEVVWVNKSLNMESLSYESDFNYDNNDHLYILSAHKPMPEHLLREFNPQEFDGIDMKDYYGNKVRSGYINPCYRDRLFYFRVNGEIVGFTYMSFQMEIYPDQDEIDVWEDDPSEIRDDHISIYIFLERVFIKRTHRNMGWRSIMSQYMPLLLSTDITFMYPWMKEHQLCGIEVTVVSEVESVGGNRFAISIYNSLKELHGGDMTIPETVDLSFVHDIC